MWLPEPPEGTPICLGFDGSDFDDWTGIRAETIDGLQFTPRYGPDRRPTIWDPKQWPDERTPRSEVHEAMLELRDRFRVKRAYCDTPRFETDIEQWGSEFPEGTIIEWPTYRPKPMHEALERFVADLQAGRMKNDGCPHTAQHLANARKITRAGRYLLGKPSQHQKIDLAMCSVLAHEAAADARAAGWGDDDGPTIFFLP